MWHAKQAMNSRDPHLPPVLEDVDSHNHAMSIGIEKVVEQLVDLLGLTTVAAIGGVGETRAVQQWIAGREPQRPNVLRFALQLAMMISTAEDRNVVRAWFQGSNPQLADRVPLIMLRNEPLEEVQAPLMGAARAFASR
jgi:hypothetical protein